MGILPAGGGGRGGEEGTDGADGVEEGHGEVATRHVRNAGKGHAVCGRGCRTNRVWVLQAAGMPGPAKRRRQLRLRLAAPGWTRQKAAGLVGCWPLGRCRCRHPVAAVWQVQARQSRPAQWQRVLHHPLRCWPAGWQRRRQLVLRRWRRAARRAAEACQAGTPAAAAPYRSRRPRPLTHRGTACCAAGWRAHTVDEGRGRGVGKCRQGAGARNSPRMQQTVQPRSRTAAHILSCPLQRGAMVARVIAAAAVLVALLPACLATMGVDVSQVRLAPSSNQATHHPPQPVCAHDLTTPPPPHPTSRRCTRPPLSA